RAKRAHVRHRRVGVRYRGPGHERLRALGRDRLPHLRDHRPRPGARHGLLRSARPDPQGPQRECDRATVAAPPQRVRAGPEPGGAGMMPLQAARNQPVVIAGILAAAGLAWWWTVQRMAGMDAGPGTDLGTLGWFTGSWVVMMAAMMLPSFAPTLAAYGTLTRGGVTNRWLLFAGGYLLAWTAAGLLAYGLFEL